MCIRDSCTNEHLSPGENYTWEYTNPLTKRHYLLKDRIIEWEGRPARMEIAFDTTESEMEKQQLKFTLDAEKMVTVSYTHLMAHLKQELEQYGPSVLLCYGGGSIKKNGIYDQVLAVLRECGKSVTEDPGVMPNPTVEKLYQGVQRARSCKADLILSLIHI